VGGQLVGKNSQELIKIVRGGTGDRECLEAPADQPAGYIVSQEIQGLSNDVIDVVPVQAVPARFVWGVRVHNPVVEPYAQGYGPGKLADHGRALGKDEISHRNQIGNSNQVGPSGPAKVPKLLVQ
jgi:hypothetical protein